MKKTILLVDDSRFFLELEKNILDSGDYEFLEAREGETALQLTISHKPDLILLDLNMPVMGGFDFMERLRTDPEICHIPVIVVTVQGHDDDVKKALQKGADDFVTKPIDNSLLMMKVRSHLQPDIIRTTPRLFIDIPVIISDFENNYHGLVHDIGPGGMFFITQHKLVLDQKVELSFDMGQREKKRTFHVFGRVVQVRQRASGVEDIAVSFDVRVQFLNVKWEDFVFLEDLVNSSTDSVLSFLMSSPKQRQEENAALQEPVPESNQNDCLSHEISRKLDEMYLLDEARERYRGHYDNLLDNLKNMQEDFRQLSFNYARLKHHYTAMTLLHVIGEQLCIQKSMPDVLTVIADILGNVIGADKYQVYILNERKERLYSLLDGSHIAGPTSHKDLNDVFVSGMPFFAKPQGAEEKRETPQVIIPIQVHGHVFGCLMIATLVPHRKTLSQTARHLVEYLARHLGVFLLGAAINTTDEKYVSEFVNRLLSEQKGL